MVIDSQTPTGVFAITGTASGAIAVAANQVIDYQAATTHVIVVK